MMGWLDSIDSNVFIINKFSVYGMNFENMPELKSEHGYYILLTVMSSISLVLLYLFRKMRWL